MNFLTVNSLNLIYKLNVILKLKKKKTKKLKDKNNHQPVVPLR